MRIERWWNPNLPQMLGIAVFLLYFNGLFGALELLGILNGGSPYALLGFTISPDLTDVVLAIAVLAYFAGGALIASSQKVGWAIGAAVAVGAVVAPFLVTSQFKLSIGLGWLFDLALAALLLHPQSRQYQKIWFS
jgi:hypothetical protein